MRSCEYCVPNSYDPWGWYDSEQVTSDFEIVMVRETHLITLFSGRQCLYSSEDRLFSVAYRDPSKTFSVIRRELCVDFSKCGAETPFDLSDIGTVRMSAIESVRLVSVENKTLSYKFHEQKGGLFQLFKKKQWLTFAGESDWKKVY